MPDAATVEIIIIKKIKRNCLRCLCTIGAGSDFFVIVCLCTIVWKYRQDYLFCCPLGQSQKILPSRGIVWGVSMHYWCRILFTYYRVFGYNFFEFPKHWKATMISITWWDGRGYMLQFLFVVCCWLFFFWWGGDFIQLVFPNPRSLVELIMILIGSGKGQNARTLSIVFSDLCATVHTQDITFMQKYFLV